MHNIVFPENNEEEFICIAEKLGCDEIIFVYPIDKFCRKKFDGRIAIKYGVLANEKNIQKAKKLSEIIVVRATEDSRHLIEKNKNLIIFDFEQSDKKDFISQRRAGLNNILCDIAKKNNITIGFSFNSLLNADKNRRKIILGRINSNLKLCRKHKLNFMFCSFAKEPFEMRSLKYAVFDVNCSSVSRFISSSKELILSTTA